MTNEMMTMEQLEGIAGGTAKALYEVELIPGGQPYPPEPKPVLPDKQSISISKFFQAAL